MASPKFSISADQIKGALKLLADNPREIFLSPICRQYFALERFKANGSTVNVQEEVSTGVMPGTVSHNRLQIDDGTFQSAHRTARLINPITSIDEVYSEPHNKQVLSIGPRTEMELLHLVGVGFLPKNIRALDLISTSSWIDVGDMHAMPYPDRSFDIVISSWVLAYSKDPQRAIDEMVRVAKDNAIVAIGCTYNPRSAEIEYERDDQKITGTTFRHISQYKDLLGERLGAIHFQHEPMEDKYGAVILVARVRH